MNREGYSGFGFGCVVVDLVNGFWTRLYAAAWLIHLFKPVLYSYLLRIICPVIYIIPTMYMYTYVQYTTREKLVKS